MLCLGWEEREVLCRGWEEREVLCRGWEKREVLCRGWEKREVLCRGWEERGVLCRGWEEREVMSGPVRGSCSARRGRRRACSRQVAMGRQGTLPPAPEQHPQPVHRDAHLTDTNTHPSNKIFNVKIIQCTTNYHNCANSDMWWSTYLDYFYSSLQTLGQSS